MPEVKILWMRKRWLKRLGQGRRIDGAGDNVALRGLVFADIEASGLQYLSYPIEVGWAWVEELHVEARSILIKPTQQWLSWKTGWNEDAEQAPSENCESHR